MTQIEKNKLHEIKYRLARVAYMRELKAGQRKGVARSTATALISKQYEPSQLVPIH